MTYPTVDLKAAFRFQIFRAKFLVGVFNLETAREPNLWKNEFANSNQVDSINTALG